MTGAAPFEVGAQPGPFTIDPAATALVVIDMQRDFLEPGGFGASLGNDVTRLRRTVEPLRVLLAAFRAAGLPVVHTREGHLPDLSDCPPSKLARGRPLARIGDPGPNGRILVRGEKGHDIIDELAPLPGEPVIDKPGKGAFYATDLDSLLARCGVRSLVVTGVTTEVCVHTTVREANDRGYECLVVSDCVGSYFPEFHRVGLEMIAAQGGIFGWVATSAAILPGLRALAPPSPVPATAPAMEPPTARPTAPPTGPATVPAMEPAVPAPAAAPARPT
jgi:biuret amidohydrolase